MDKNVGKLMTIAVIGLLYCACFLRAADLELRALSMRGRPIDAIGIGEPFVLEVSLKDVSGRMPAPTLAQNQSYTINSTQQSFMIINGQRAYQYRYVVHMDAQGKHIVGPATIVHNGTTLTSNTITLEVDQSTESIKGQEAFLRFVVDKERAVVGEQINCVLTFYYAKDSIELKTIEPPQFVRARLVGDLNKHTSGTEKINGTRYYYERWEWQLYPEASGTLIIPASRAEYEIEGKRAYNMPFMMFSRAERKRIYSNAVQIEVAPLPPCKETVYAVGEFVSFEASVHPTVAKAGEALVLTLAIEGNGDMGALTIPQLSHMPDALRYYESKNYIEPTHNHFLVNKFEYVVQGMQEGEWTIPAQSFVYFDTKSRTYKKLTTIPLAVTVLPNAAIQQPAQTASDVIESTVEIDTPVEQQCMALDETDKWYPVHERHPLPWWLFFMVFFIPFYYVGFLLIRGAIRRYRAKSMQMVRAKNAFKLARAELDKARVHHDHAQVYVVMRQFFADRYMVAPTHVTQQFIIERLQSAGMSAHVINQWDEFFSIVVQQVFGDTHKNDDRLFNDAQQWLILLEGIL
ncbi:MAG TPA: BatD family protein [Candidatus Dependentiae bacterium]|nr:BatD family protein [Candidatus Dependentiae bacterium]HRQ62685.1 BatD family protein [Candidatus Dependentiae bacterium]